MRVTGVMEIFTHRVLKLSLIIGGLLIASTMALTSDVRSEWREVPVDKIVTANVPGMENWKPYHYQSVDEGSNRGVLYWTGWGTIANPGTHAMLTLQKRSRQFEYYKMNYMIRFVVEDRYQAEITSIYDEIHTHTSKLGEFEIREFSAKKAGNVRRCTAYYLMRSGRRQFIYGHYCPSDNKPVTMELVATLIDSIRLEVDVAE